MDEVQRWQEVTSIVWRCSGWTDGSGWGMERHANIKKAAGCNKDGCDARCIPTYHFTKALNG